MATDEKEPVAGQPPEGGQGGPGAPSAGAPVFVPVDCEGRALKEQRLSAAKAGFVGGR